MTHPNYARRFNILLTLLILLCWGLFANTGATTTLAEEPDGKRVSRSATAASLAADLNAAIALFNTMGSGEELVIEFDNDIILPIATTPIDNATSAHLIIDGLGLYKLDGNNAHRGLTIERGNVTVEGLTITNARALFGGGINNRSGGSLTISNSTLSGNSTFEDGEGGGIGNSGTLTVTNSTISGNSAVEGGNGGGIVNYGTLTVNGSTISGNSAILGGGISNNTTSATMDLIDSTVSGNSAEWRGGGIENNGTLTVRNSIITGNSVSGHDGTDGNFSDGGGIYNLGGTVTLTNSTLSGNSAFRGGGIFNQDTSVTSTVIVSNSTISGNSADAIGGGIVNWDVMTINGSNITGNNALFFDDTGGGGIYNLGNLVIDNSTLAGNASSFRGGAINNNQGTLTVGSSTFVGNAALAGAGIQNSGSATIGNSTFSGNSGDGIVNFDTITISNSTITGNSGEGINNGGAAGLVAQMTVNNSIIANRVDEGPVCARSSVAETPTFNHSIIEDASCNSTGGANAGNNNLIGDPSLGPLADNGGSTKTHALLTGSIAIDAGDNTICAAAPISGIDQRGRPRETACDIGAYEEFTSGACAATHDNGATVQFSTDASAVQRAILGSSQGSTVKVAGSCVGGSLQPIGVPLVAYIDHALTLEGGHTPTNWGAPPNSILNPTILDGDGDRVIILYDANGTGNMPVTLDSLTIRNGNTPVDLAPFGLNGGGIFVGNGVRLTLDDATVSDNSAAFGGGIFVDQGGRLTINSSFLSGNNATGSGGGIYNDQSLATTVSYSTLSGNSAASNGGGIYNTGGPATVSYSVLFDNSATGSGGGMFNAASGEAMVDNSTFLENSATSNGGGIFSQGTTTVGYSRFQENTADFGAGILIASESGPVTVSDSHFAVNTATASGGGIFNADAVTVNSSSFFGNNGDFGGGIFNGTSATAEIGNTTLSNNFAGNSGGGLYNSGTVTTTNSTFADNLSDLGDGSSIFNQDTATVRNSILAYGDFASECAGTSPSFSNSLVEDGSCGVTDGTNGNLTGDPLLGAKTASANGGPTSTRTLIGGSKAIDAGDNSVCNAAPINGLDQRGVSRDANCDMGAYEFNSDAVIASWSATDYVVDEDAGTVSLTVKLHKAAAGTVTVNYATTNGTATTGSDFTGKSGTLTFTSGQLTQTVEIALTNDAVGESTETFRATLSNPTNAELGNPKQTTVAIVDDDQPNVSFSTASHAVSEGGAKVTLTVQLNRTSDSTVTVDYRTRDETAAAGSDYTAKSGTLTFTPGQTSKTIEVAITEDGDDETNETFVVLLSNAVNAGFGIPSTATVTINDNDTTATAPNFTVFLPAVIR